VKGCFISLETRLCGPYRDCELDSRLKWGSQAFQTNLSSFGRHTTSRVGWELKARRSGRGGSRFLSCAATGGAASTFFTSWERSGVTFPLPPPTSYYTVTRKVASPGRQSQFAMRRRSAATRAPRLALPVANGTVQVVYKGPEAPGPPICAHTSFPAVRAFLRPRNRFWIKFPVAAV
jgi:hypothetical protein